MCENLPAAVGDRGSDSSRRHGTGLNKIASANEASCAWRHLRETPDSQEEVTIPSVPNGTRVAAGRSRSTLLIGLALSFAGCYRDGFHYRDDATGVCWPACADSTADGDTTTAADPGVVPPVTPPPVTPPPTQQATGALDPTFGTAGIYRLDIGGANNVARAAQGLDLQPDGRIVIAGVVGAGTNHDFLVLRLLESGALDATFGAGGTTTIDFGGADDFAESVRVQSNGTIVVAGQSNQSTSVARLLTNGALDSSFAGTGRRVLALTTDFELVNTQVTLPDGRLRLCGHGRLSASSPTGMDLVVYGLLADGSLDPAFGSGSFAALDFFASDDFGGWCSLDAAGRLLVSGQAMGAVVGTFLTDFAVARLLADGSYDASFSDGAGLPGRVATDFAALDDGVGACALDASGRIVCAGSATDTTGTHFALVRYLQGGGLDSTFGTGGRLMLTMGSNDEARALIILADGRLMVGGFAKSARGDNDFALAALNSDGSLATGFGVNGSVTIDTGAGRDDVVHALRVDAAGRLVVYGDAINAAGDNDIVVLRMGL